MIDRAVYRMHATELSVEDDYVPKLAFSFATHSKIYSTAFDNIPRALGKAVQQFQLDVVISSLKKCQATAARFLPSAEEKREKGRASRWREELFPNASVTDPHHYPEHEQTCTGGL
ncbi:hypothetical protein F2P79_010324 [Pimephales promelas]|nr:hypothetical protein F2P79_010324 [Pimephales promelas]